MRARCAEVRELPGCTRRGRRECQGGRRPQSTPPRCPGRSADALAPFGRHPGRAVRFAGRRRRGNAWQRCGHSQWAGSAEPADRARPGKTKTGQSAGSARRVHCPSPSRGPPSWTGRALFTSHSRLFTCTAPSSPKLEIGDCRALAGTSDPGPASEGERGRQTNHVLNGWRRQIQNSRAHTDARPFSVCVRVCLPAFPRAGLPARHSPPDGQTGVPPGFYRGFAGGLPRFLPYQTPTKPEAAATASCQSLS